MIKPPAGNDNMEMEMESSGSYMVKGAANQGGNVFDDMQSNATYVGKGG